MSQTRLRVAFGADDSNECVDAVREYLRAETDLFEAGADDPWPSMAQNVASRVASGEASFGVLMCWTGTGTAIAANKVPGVRAAQASDAWLAEGARLWNDANVLTMSLKRTPPDVAVECVRAFLATTQIDPDEAENVALLTSFDDDLGGHHGVSEADRIRSPRGAGS